MCHDFPTKLSSLTVTNGTNQINNTTYILFYVIDYILFSISASNCTIQ